MARPEAITTLERASEYRKQEAGYVRRASKTDAQEHLGLLRQDPLYQQARGLVVFDRWEHLAQKTPEFSQETWEKAAGVLSAGCNNGVKARLWIEIAQTTTPQTHISVDDLYERYKTIFAGSSLLQAPAGKDAKACMVSYCQDSLCEVGLVAAKVNLAGKVIGFSIREEGQSYLDAAYLTLWFEHNNNQSLFPILGPTPSSGDTRAPLNRTKILDYLIRRPYRIRQVDLATDLQIAASPMGNHLELLAKLGLIDYKTINSYRLVKTPLQYEFQVGRDHHEAGYFITNRRLQDEVVRTIGLLTTSSLRFSIAAIVNRLPDEVKSRWNTVSLRREVNRILSGFAKEGYLSRVDNFKGKKKQSDANMTSKGRSFVSSFIWPVLSIIEGRPLTEGQRARIALAKKNLDSFAQTSVELYYPYSQSAKIRAKKEHLGKCIELLLGAKEPLIAWDLAETLGLSTTTIRRYLRPKIEASNQTVINIGGKKITIGIKSIKGVRYYSVLSVEAAS